jgi:hypothetical protein
VCSAAVFFAHNLQRSVRAQDTGLYERVFEQLQAWSATPGISRRVLQLGDVFAQATDAPLARVGEIYRDFSWPQVYLTRSIESLEAEIHSGASAMVLVSDRDLPAVLAVASPAAFLRVRLREKNKAGFWLLDYSAFEYPISEMESWERTFDFGAANFGRIYGLRPHRKHNGITLDLLRGPRAAFLFPAHQFQRERGAVLRVLVGNTGRSPCAMKVALNGEEIGELSLAPGQQHWIDYRVAPGALQVGQNLMQLRGVTQGSDRPASCTYDFNWLKVRPQH